MRLEDVKGVAIYPTAVEGILAAMSPEDLEATLRDMRAIDVSDALGPEVVWQRMVPTWVYEILNEGKLAGRIEAKPDAVFEDGWMTFAEVRGRIFLLPGDPTFLERWLEGDELDSLAHRIERELGSRANPTETGYKVEGGGLVADLEFYDEETARYQILIKDATGKSVFSCANLRDDGVVETLREHGLVGEKASPPGAAQ